MHDDPALQRVMHALDPRDTVRLKASKTVNWLNSTGNLPGGQLSGDTASTRRLEMAHLGGSAPRGPRSCPDADTRGGGASPLITSAWRVVGAYTPAGTQVGFARAISDGFGVAYLADVYVLNTHRGLGLGKRILETMIDNGPGRHFRWMLHTNDAHGIYTQFGFAEPDHTYLERRGGAPSTFP